MFASLGYYICIPFAWLIRVFYNLTGSYGVAIILFTLATKIILLPFQLKSKKSMMRMNRMNGRIQEIQKKYANNQAKMSEEMQKLYAEEGVNPMSGCLWSFLPLPILIALYSIIRQLITHFMMLKTDVLEGLISKATAAGVDMSNIVNAKDATQLTPYGQINLVNVVNSMPEIQPEGWINMNYQFLGLDLTATPWDAVKNFAFTGAVIGLILIPILAGLFQLFMSMYTMKTQNQQGAAANSMKSMMYMMPLMSVYIGFIMPAALGVYWVAQSVFSIIQEWILGKFYNQKIEEEETAREEARQADRKRRMEEAKEKDKQRQLQETKKQTLREKQQAAQEAKAEKAKKAANATTEAGRVGDRPYARGRSFSPDHYGE